MFKNLTPCTFTIGLYLWKVNRKVELAVLGLFPYFSSSSSIRFFLIFSTKRCYALLAMLARNLPASFLRYDVIFIVALFFFFFSSSECRGSLPVHVDSAGDFKKPGAL